MNDEQKELAEKVLADLGLENLQDPLKSELIESIRDRVAQKTMMVLMENISEAEIPSLEVAIESKGEEAAIEELSKRVPDLNTKLSKALGELYQELINDTKKAIEESKEETSKDQLSI